jgi:hypothetical protein
VKKEPPAADKAEPAESVSKPESVAPKKRKSIRDATGAAPEKKAKTNTKACKLEKEAIGSTVAKGVTRVRQREASFVLCAMLCPSRRIANTFTS